MKAHRPKVLIVDCHEDVLMNFERLLEDAGYDTTTAWTAQDARNAVQEGAFDLILVNEYLPEIDAEDFMSELRSQASTVPCIVMQPSATRITDTRRFLTAGAVEVVCKWSQADVLEAVGVHIGLPDVESRRPQGATAGSQQWH